MDTELLSLVREGNVEILSQQLSQTLKSSKDSPENIAQHNEVFGLTSWTAGMTLLLWAIEGTEVLIKYYPALIQTGDSQGATPLHYACLNGDLPMAKFLLGHSAKPVPDLAGETPLHLASLNGHHEIVKLLLELGSNPNIKSSSGSTALHYAIINSQVKVASNLLSHPAVDISIKDEQGKTALEIALQKGNKQLSDCFDQDKRAKIDHLAEINTSILKYESNIRDLTAAKIQDDASLVLVQKKLTEQQSINSQLRSKVSSLESKLAEQTVRSDESYELEYQEVVAKLNEQRRRNAHLHDQLNFKELQNEMEKTTISSTVLDTHRSLQNLISLMDVANIALLNAKTEIESIQGAMRVKSPQDSALHLVQENKYNL